MNNANNSNNSNKSNDTVDLHNVKFLNIEVDYIIFFASIILPFVNEIAITLTKSGLPMFHNLYRVCVHNDIFTVMTETCKQNKKIQCTNIETFRGLFIDALAYLGIILNIGRNTLKYGYITGVVSGFVLILCSIVFTNLYLGQIIHKLKDILDVKTPFMNIVIGLICIIILVFATSFLQNISSKLFQHYKIDKINEPVLKNKTEEKILQFLE
jgi:hypothetical protein